MTNPMLRNKKRMGRGMRIGLGGCSCANTRHLKRVLIYLKNEEMANLTKIHHETLINTCYVKDALLFLCRINLIEKFHVSRAKSSGYYYKLKDKTIYDEKN